MVSGIARDDAGMTSTFTVAPRGPFSLREAALFGFGPRAEKDFDGVMRLAFCVDAYRSHRPYQDQVGVEVRQDESGLVQGTVVGPGAGAAAAGRRAAGVAASRLGAAGLVAVPDKGSPVVIVDV